MTENCVRIDIGEHAKPGEALKASYSILPDSFRFARMCAKKFLLPTPAISQPSLGFACSLRGTLYFGPSDNADEDRLLCCYHLYRGIGVYVL